MPRPPFSLRRCNWDEARSDARRIRELVFVREQGVPLELEMDEHDARCDHALGFCRRYGFAVSGAEFMEAGIPHRAMQRELNSGGG